MEELQKKIEDWSFQNSAFVGLIAFDTLQVVFESGLTEKFIFQVYTHEHNRPFFVASEAPELSSWVERMNTFIQRKAPEFDLFLLEMRKSLMILWQIEDPEKSKQNRVGAPTRSYRTGSLGSSTSSGSAGFYTESIPSGPPSTTSISSSFSSSPSPIPPPPPPPLPPTSSSAWLTSEKHDDTYSKHEETIKTELNEWIKKNHSLIELKNFDTEKCQIVLCFGHPAVDFEINYDREWNLVSISSDAEELKPLLPTINSFLSQMHPSISAFLKYFNATLFLKLEGDNNVIKSADEIKELLIKTVQDIEKSEEESKVDPVEEDWEKHIIPELHKLMIKDSFEDWSIDEWLAILRMEIATCNSTEEKNYSSVLRMISTQLLEGADPPDAIRKFFKKETVAPPRSRWNYPKGATLRARKLLEEQANKLFIMDSKSLGFKATPIRRNIFHWFISLFGFEPHCAIYQQLANYTISQAVTSGDENVKLNDIGFVNTVDIQFEVKLPNDYPNGSPLYRLIRPRFINMDEASIDVSFASEVEEAGSEPENDTNGDETNHPTNTSIEYNNKKLHPLSVSMKLEKETWKLGIPSIYDFAINLRKAIMNSTKIQVDLSSTKEGIKTDGSFWQEFTCVSLASLDGGRPESEVGGKIYLPSSCLQDLIGGVAPGVERFGVFGTGKHSPMIFEISSQSGLRSFVGVMEFIAPQGCVGVPSWLMEHLGLTTGQSVQIRKVHLPKGLYVQLQPHSGDVNKLPDLKATLEWVLRRFVALTVGDTIVIEHEHQKFKFDVLKCSPERAVAITDQDVSVDFVKPLDGSEMKSQAELDNLEKKPTTLSPSITGDKPAGLVTSGQMDSEGVEGVHFSICANCKQRIPIAQITMHQLRCERINWYCEACNVVVLKTDREKHFDQFHSLIKCEACKKSLEQRQMADHLKSDCPQRMDNCLFCKLPMQYTKKFSHEQSCGAVTELCSKCNRRFARTAYVDHERNCSGVPPPPAVSNPVFSRRVPSSYSTHHAPTSDLLICHTCLLPCHSFEDLQVHLLTEHHDDNVEALIASFGSATVDPSPNEINNSTAGTSLEEKDEHPPVVGNSVTCQGSVTSNSGSHNDLDLPSSNELGTTTTPTQTQSTGPHQLS